LIAAKLGLPFFLQVHDDFQFSSRGHVPPALAEEAMGAAWREAAVRFVVCDRLGQEYCERYGHRDYIIITDGLKSVAPRPASRQSNELRVYFMGLFHFEYAENLDVLCRALDQVQRMRPSLGVTIRLRCGMLHRQIRARARQMVRVLPFATEADVERDLQSADLLYLPLPFDKDFEAFVRFSLPTKVVTYLGSGVPILYHGPERAAVHQLLSKHSAAFLHTSLNVASLAGLIGQICDQPESGMEVSANALHLARSQFMLQDQRAKFWGAIARVVGPESAQDSPIRQ
jgi:hypothetical protein